MVSKKHLIVVILVLAITGSVVFVLDQSGLGIKKDLPIVSQIPAVSTDNKIPKIHNPGESINEVIDSKQKYFRIRNVGPAEEDISTSTQTIEGEYTYLFKEMRDPNVSNIVGYFAHGAFAWSVPNWLVSNWDMKPFRDEGMIFSAKIKANLYDFSDIVFDVSTSTELNNAENLHFAMLRSIPKDEIIISEVLLNKATNDIINLQMENSTRIYHIAAYTSDFKSITDLYFMDGNGKTLDLRFETKADIYSQFSDKIRDMVEGIGELKVPQG